MMSPPQFAIDAAVQLAITSPCCKSKRGVVIYQPGDGGMLISGGHNAPPRPLGCDGSHACMANCAKLCEHAEMEALRDMNAHYLDQLELLHVKTVDGQLVVSGGPSCWQCSRSIARERRVVGVWLFHDTGWRRYTTEDFHKLTLKACGLPIIEGHDA